MTDDAVSEVKNVARLSYTRQLRDYADYASANGLRVYEQRRVSFLHRRLGTRVGDIYGRSGRGLRYTEEGKFLGFLEPPR